MAEYGVVLAVIAIGVVVALGLLSTSISGAIDSVSQQPVVRRRNPRTGVLIVQYHGRHRINEFLTFLSREHAQAKPDKTVTLTVISGTSFSPSPGSRRTVRVQNQLGRLFT